MESPGKKVTKAILGCRAEKEIQEDLGHRGFTEESPVDVGCLGFPDPRALQAHLATGGSLVSRDFQVTRVSWVFQGPPAFQELMEQEDLKEAKVTLQVSLAPLVQRVSQVALDVQGTLDPPGTRACLVLKGPEDHRGGQERPAPPDRQAVQVIKGSLGPWDIQEKWGTLDQEASWGTQGYQVFRE